MSAKTSYTAGVNPQTDPALIPLASETLAWPVAPVRGPLTSLPLCRVRVRHESDAALLLTAFVPSLDVFEVTLEQQEGIDPDGLTNLYHELLPDTALMPLHHWLPTCAGGHQLAFDVADYPQKRAEDDRPYEVMIVLEYLERCPELESLRDMDLARRIYADAVAANQHFLSIDLDAYRYDPLYSVLQPSLTA